MGSTRTWSREREIRGPLATVISLAWLLLLALAGAAPASGEIRTLNLDDPSDVTPTLSGVPTQLDIKNLQVRLNTDDGSFSIRTELYRAPDAVDTSEKYAFYATFDFATAIGRRCYSTVAQGQHHWYSDRVQFYDQATVSGYDGKAQLTRTMTEGGRVATITGVLKPLIGVDVRCFAYAIRHRTYSSITNIHSRYDEWCGCWYLPGFSDGITGDERDPYGLEGVFFDGLKPPPPIKKVEADLRLKAAGRRGKAEIFPKVQPRQTNEGVQPFTGKVKVVFWRNWRKLFTKRLKANAKTTVRLAPGKYVITGAYMGDKWRTGTNQLDSKIRVTVLRKRR